MLREVDGARRSEAVSAKRIFIVVDWRRLQDALLLAGPDTEGARRG